MKKQLACLMTAVLSLSMFAGCGGGNNGGGASGDLSIMVYAAGYGMEWVDEAIRVYKEDHPDIEISAEGDPLAFESIKTQLENGNCSYDIILVDTGYYDQFVANDLLLCLDDVYASTIPGTEKTVSDVVNPQVQQHRAINGKMYGIPWQQNNASGLIYNVEMFREYGWDQDMPETMDEFWALCDKIDTDTKGNVAPIAFGGADGNGYLAYNPAQWLCEYYGYDGMMDFLKLDSMSVFTDQEAGRTKIYETLAKLTMGKTVNGRNIALEGSVGATAITAQTNFVNGAAAMMVCGQWFPTEMQPYTDLVQFESGYLPMPHINADKRSGDGKVDTSKVRFSTDGNFMAIPSTAKNPELAKDFLLTMFTEKSYSSFIKANNGLLRPIQGLEVDATGFDLFTKQAYEYFNADGEAETVYQITPNRVLENGTVAIFQAYKGSFFSTITGQATWDAALSVARGCYANEIGVLMAKWDAENKKWN